MTRTIGLFALVCLTCACSRAPESGDRGPKGAGTSKIAVAAPPSAMIKNRFGMTFRLVSVEPKPEGVGDVGEFGVAFPKESYYLEQTRLTDEQFDAFKEFAAQGERGKSTDQRKLYEFPNAWNLAHNFGVALSALDPEYEYRLPTREQWVFACMNGYDQDCPADAATPYTSKRPNKFGIEGFLTSDVECGNLPGLHFGAFPTYPPQQDPGCQCARYGFGNPEGDDGFEDVVVARYVLIPRAKP